jgi:hypothetical protein
MLDEGGYRGVRWVGNALDCRFMGTFERFTTKTHFNSLKRLVVLVGLAVLAVKLAVTAFWAVPAGSPLDLLARLAASVADLGAVLLAGWVPALAWGWRSQQAGAAGDGPGGLGPGWLLARPVDEGLSGFLLGPGRPLVLAVAVVPAVLWVRRRPGRAYAAVGLALLAPLALTPAFTPRELVWPLVFGYLGDARWASIYAAVAGAALLWTSAWWGPVLPWDGGVAAGAVPAAGRGTALGLAAWAVLVVWLGFGWRTVAVESRRPRDHAAPDTSPSRRFESLPK